MAYDYRLYLMARIASNPGIHWQELESTSGTEEIPRLFAFWGALAELLSSDRVVIDNYRFYPRHEEPTSSIWHALRREP